jgi:hypothetical protein
MTPEQMQQALVDEMGMDADEAAHFLVDAGEVDSCDHAELLSPAERERIYGE